MKGYLEENLKEIDEILKFEPDPAFARRARIIFENLNLKRKEKILEIGCGRGFYLRTLKSVWPEIDVTGVDINSKYLEIARGFMKDLRGDLKDDLKESLRVKLRVADATDLPFKNDSFDRIIASEVLEHIPDDEKAIAEMYRVLKPGGIALVTVPNKNYPFCWDPLNWILERVFGWHLPSNIWWLAGIWADHVRLYDEKELKDKVEKKDKKGFKVEKIWQATHYCLPFSHFLLYGIGKNLVEKGILKTFNRFSENKEQSLVNKIILWPVRFIDSSNSDDSGNVSSVNLILKVRKRR